MRANLISLLSLCVVLAGPFARAELYECNGTWTNKPCDSSQKTATIKDSSSSEQAIDPQKKRRWTEELTRLSERAKAEDGVAVDVSEAVSTCLVPVTTNDECRSLVNKKESEVYSRQRTARAEKKKSELATKADQGKTETNVTNVNISEENSVVSVAGSNQKVKIGGRETPRTIPPTNDPRDSSDALRRRANDPSKLKGVLDNSHDEEMEQLKALKEIEAARNKSNQRIGHGGKR